MSAPQGEGRTHSLSHKPSLLFALVARMPTRERFLTSAKAPSQTSFAIFSFCQDTVSWQR